MTSPIDLVLSRLEPFKLRQQGRDRWRACCPAHGGKNPSALSIGVSADDAVLLKCWQGCNVEAIAGALGLDLTDLFPLLQQDHHAAAPMKRRRLLSAGQALELLDGEAHLLMVCASDLANGRGLDDPTRQRLARAAARIALMRSEVSA